MNKSTMTSLTDSKEWPKIPENKAGDGYEIHKDDAYYALFWAMSRVDSNYTIRHYYYYYPMSSEWMIRMLLVCYQPR